MNGEDVVFNADIGRSANATEQGLVAAAKMSAGISADPIYRMALRELRSIKAHGVVLDFGAGTGHLAQLLCGMDAFSEVVAADLLEFEGAAHHPKLRWIFADLNHPLPCEEASFDVVVGVEVIEHLENPRAVARECFRLLKPGGSLLLSTPNNESWRSILALIGKKHFAAFTDESYPAHLTALVRADLHRVCTEAGFTNVRFRFTDQGCIPKWTAKTWQQVSRGRLRGVRFSDNLLCVAQKPA